MGIIPTLIVFFLVTIANIINTRYLIEANDGLKKRSLPTKGGLKIDNDYANLMYQVSLVHILDVLVIWKIWVLHFLRLLLYDSLGSDAGYNDFDVRFH
mgnify:CR=1 FL=1